MYLKAKNSLHTCTQMFSFFVVFIAFFCKKSDAKICINIPRKMCLTIYKKVYVIYYFNLVERVSTLAESSVYESF